MTEIDGLVNVYYMVDLPLLFPLTTRQSHDPRVDIPSLSTVPLRYTGRYRGLMMLVARMRWIESQSSQNFGNADSAEARMRVDGTESNSEELATRYKRR